MPTKKYKQKLMKHRICVAARAIACVAFLVLTVIGVSSLVRAMSLDTVEHQNGIPSSWKVASLGRPKTITVPITYWDQRQDSCDDENRQFEWVMCGYWTSGTIQGVVKDRLGSDGTPVPSFTTAAEAWVANRDVFTANVTGHDPLLSTDNFYRWFHDTDKSKSYQDEITFNQVGDSNTYEYDSGGFFPLDDVDFSADDEATAKHKHNFHFTAHMSIAMKVAADGTEEFRFSGDDDVWVFLNGKLVLDLGGLHEILTGHFKINQDGSITAYTQSVNDPSVRDQLGEPSNDFNGYVNPLNQLNKSTFKDKTVTIDAGLEPGDIVNLDFFYAERSTTASNNKITISNMNWPISAGSDIEGKIVGKVEGTESNLVEYITSVTNRDPMFPLELEKIATYINDESTETTTDGSTTPHKNAGFLPHTSKTLMYTTTPDDEDSWQPVEISAPLSNETGFTLATPITMAPSGQAGDTLYFRFLAETSEYDGTIYNQTSYYTKLNGVAGVTYDHTSVKYTGKQPTVVPDDPDPEPYHLTVKYEIDWQGQDPDPEIEAKVPGNHEEDIPAGETYNVPTPEIDGFTPNQLIVSGEMPEDDLTITVKYTKDEEEVPTYKVHIRYIRSDTGAEVFPEYKNDECPEGTHIEVYPQDAEGFTKDTEEINFIVTEDTEITVLYTPVPDKPEEGPIIPPFTPVTPTDPEDPEDPETPDTPDDPEEELPIIPVVPGEDDDLAYLPPLGEVAFVPNTGVISEYVAPIFDQYFANVILSQGFVLVTLLIFSGSFATYFSLRQYLNLATNTRNVAPVKKMPKNIGNSKTARNMQKAAKKSAKTTVAKKSTRSASKKTKK